MNVLVFILVFINIADIGKKHEDIVYCKRWFLPIGTRTRGVSFHIKGRGAVGRFGAQCEELLRPGACARRVFDGQDVEHPG